MNQLVCLCNASVISHLKVYRFELLPPLTPAVAAHIKNAFGFIHHRNTLNNVLKCIIKLWAWCIYVWFVNTFTCSSFFFTFVTNFSLSAIKSGTFTHFNFLVSQNDQNFEENIIFFLQLILGHDFRYTNVFLWKWTELF